jgi:hypothetical protein
MGWASGSGLLFVVLEIVWKHIPQASRLTVAKKLINVFEAEDCDTIGEVFNKRRWPEIEIAYNKLHPELDEDEDDGEE